MVQIDITYICDRCGKVKKERTITTKGYEDCDSILQNKDAGFIPHKWTVYENYKKLLCPNCTKKLIHTNYVGMG